MQLNSPSVRLPSHTKRSLRPSKHSSRPTPCRPLTLARQLLPRFQEIVESDDGREGMNAFLNKRTPDFA